MDLTAQERQKYDAIWSVPAYRERSPGFRVLDTALKWMRPADGTSFIDFGCGAGQAAHAIHDLGHPITLVDISADAYRGNLPFVQACLWELPDSLMPADHATCNDVMEHLPPEKVADVLDAIAVRTKVSAFFQIALFKEHFGDQIGQVLHLSVFPPKWWQRRILRSFASAEFRMASGGRHLLAVARP